MLTESLKEKWLNELGLRDKNGKKDYSFDLVIKYCKELNICNFKKTKANKKDLEKWKGILLKIKEKYKVISVSEIQNP